MARGEVPTKPPTFSTRSWASLVRVAWGDSWGKPDTAYEFSNGRTFKDPAQNGGPYSPEDPGQ